MNNKIPPQETTSPQDTEHQKRINRIKTAINTYMRKEHGVKAKHGSYYESIGNPKNKRDQPPPK